MKTLSNLKIGVRLGLAFGMVLCLTLALSLFALNRMARIQGNVEDLATNWLLASRALAAFDSDVSSVRRMESRHLLASTPQEFAELEKRIDGYKADALTQWKRYESTITEAEEKRIADDIRSTVATYQAATVKLLALSRQNQSKAEEAKAYYNGESKAAFEAMRASLDKDLAYQDKGAAQAYKDAIASYDSTRMTTVALILLTLAIGAALAYTITRSITVPMARAKDASERIAEGDLTVDLEVSGRDETGQLLGALQAMKNNLTTIVHGVRQNADSVATASAQIAQGNTDLSSRTEEQASALEETAASMEELSGTVKQNADNARQGNQLAQNASQVAVKGGEVVGQVVHTMKGINDASQKIADIIGVIDGIAFQTNILALNAAVEAARAGEQGRGFAVVASEVRSLAGRSAEAAKEIKALISDSVQRVESGTALVDQAGATMTEVVNAIRRVADIMGEISAASTEQSTGVAQVGEAVTQMDQATQQNAALVEESAAAAESLKSQAHQLVQAVSVFKLAHGGQASLAASPVTQATAPPASRLPAIERRGPGRAANVKRLAPKPASRADAADLPDQVPTRKVAVVGGAGDWTSF